MRERERQRQKQAPCREPNIGLNPGTLGSGPEPKTDAQLLSEPGTPRFFILIFKKYFIYLFMRHTHTHTHTERQRQKQAPCREPDVGLDPGSPGSQPRLKAMLNHGATRAAP